MKPIKPHIKRIHILELGGTIASKNILIESEFYPSPTESLEAIINAFNFNSCEITSEIFCQKISHNISLDELITLAKRAQSILDCEEYDGLIVTSGTNALEDISYFIGLVVKTIKPIVFTGSHFPQNSLSFDGKKNLFNAIKIALSDDSYKLGVLVTFNDYVVTARDAIKLNPGLLNNFSLDNNGVVGHVIGGNFRLKLIPNYRHTFRSNFSAHELVTLFYVPIVYSHLGMDDLFVRASINAGVMGIVSAGFGKGYQPENVTQVLQEAVKCGISVVRCSRIGIGYTNYDPIHDDKNGFIVAYGLPPNKASLLLSLSLGVSKDKNWLQSVFKEY